MKIIYTILFFIDTMFLIGLSYLFLEDMDNGSKTWTLIFVFSGFVFCVILLIFLLSGYLKLPARRRREK